MKVGNIAFLAGLAIAVIGAFVSFDWFPWLLAALGLVVGFLNVSGTESNRFLVASIAFMLSAGALKSLPLAGEMITNVMMNISTFVGAAALIVAIMALFDMSKDS